MHCCAYCGAEVPERQRESLCWSPDCRRASMLKRAVMAADWRGDAAEVKRLEEERRKLMKQIDERVEMAARRRGESR